MAKQNIVSMGRGIIYAGAKVIPMYSTYKTHVDGGETQAVALQHVMYNQIGMRPDGSFDWNIVKEQWAPLVGWTIADTVASKLGIWRRMSRMLGSIKMG